MALIEAKDIMVKVPLAVEPDTSMARVERILVLCQLNEVYVVGHRGELLGIVPDYEFLKARLLNESSWKRVEQAMLPVCQTVKPSDSIHHIALLLRENYRQRIAVVENCILVGIITRQSVLRALLDESVYVPASPIVPSPKFLESAIKHPNLHRQNLPHPAS